MNAPLPILVTGAAGLLGRAAIERLRAEGRPVLAVDRIPPEAMAGVQAAVVDLGDREHLARLVSAGVDGIIHCGGISGAMVAPDRPEEIAQTNVGGTITLLEAARRASVRRFVYCSSLGAYGGSPPGLAAVTEDAPLAAKDIYGASKAAGDLLVRAYAHEHGLDAVVLRIGWVYGPRRRTASLLGRFIRDAVDGKPTLVDHDGTDGPPFVYVDDVAEALVAACDAAEVRGRAFNIAGAERVSFEELAALVRQILPSADIRFTPGRKSTDDRLAPIDLSAAARALGWRPRTDLAEGIARYATWLARNPY